MEAVRLWNKRLLRPMSIERASPLSYSPLVSGAARDYRCYGIVLHRQNTTVEPQGFGEEYAFLRPRLPRRSNGVHVDTF